MSFKRARAEINAGGAFTLPDKPEPEDLQRIQGAARKFRAFLLEKYSSGVFTASDTCILAYLHCEAGGLGAEDLALSPSQASKHASGHLRRRELLLTCGNFWWLLFKISFVSMFVGSLKLNEHDS